MFAEDFSVLDAGSTLWPPARPLLNAALNLEQQDALFSWHGWKKSHIDAFLQDLPTHCALLVGVWEPDPSTEDGLERLSLGLICEVTNGSICSLRTFESLVDPDLPAVSALEPGFEHARELLRVTKTLVAPVAWALFTDLTTWQEWFFSAASTEPTLPKGTLLASLASQGRCVLMGSRAMHHHI